MCVVTFSKVCDNSLGNLHCPSSVISVRTHFLQRCVVQTKRAIPSTSQPEEEACGLSYLPSGKCLEVGTDLCLESRQREESYIPPAPFPWLCPDQGLQFIWRNSSSMSGWFSVYRSSLDSRSAEKFKSIDQKSGQRRFTVRPIGVHSCTLWFRSAGLYDRKDRGQKSIFST